MANREVTFDEDSGTSFVSNLTIQGGASFSNTFEVKKPNGTAFDLTGYSGSAQMAKSVAVGATLGATETFTVGITSAAAGKIKVSLAATTTRGISAGRYVYDLLVTDSLEQVDVLSTGIAVGQTAGIGTTAFVLNKITNVAVGDSISVGAAITTVPVVSIASTLNKVTIGTANTSPLEVLPGTAVTFTRVGSASTIYRIVQGNIIVKAAISESP